MCYRKSNFQKIEKKYEFHEISVGETSNIEEVNVVTGKATFRKVKKSMSFMKFPLEKQ